MTLFRLARSFRVARTSTRFLSTTRVLAQTKVATKTATNLSEVTGPDDSLIGAGAQPGTIPTDIDQATGLERFEFLGKREGIDVFDVENPIFEGKGTYNDPYLVPTYVGYRYVGCRGKISEGEEDHKAYWMKVEGDKLSRCWQCGTAFKGKYLGRPEHSHH